MKALLIHLFSKHNFNKISTKAAILIFIIFNLLFWGIVLDHEIRSIFYLFLRNLAGNSAFVGAVGALITGAISTLIGILWAYNPSEDKK
jgi:hypothetical protein